MTTDTLRDDVRAEQLITDTQQVLFQSGFALTLQDGEEPSTRRFTVWQRDANSRYQRTVSFLLDDEHARRHMAEYTYMGATAAASNMLATATEANNE